MEHEQLVILYISCVCMPASFVYVCVNSDVYSNCVDSAVILCCLCQLSRQSLCCSLML